MASGGKRKTTMAKLNRERKLAERRLDKQARKEARKQAAAQGVIPGDETSANFDEVDDPAPGQRDLDPVPLAER
jgi:hypothetical protein